MELFFGENLYERRLERPDADTVDVFADRCFHDLRDCFIAESGAFCVVLSGGGDAQKHFSVFRVRRDRGVCPACHHFVKYRLDLRLTHAEYVQAF